MSKTTLLEQKEIIVVTPHVRFVASDFFHGWQVGSNFEDLFLGVIEETDGQPVEIALYNLSEWLVDGPIVEELGGAPRVAISLATFGAIAATGRSFVALVRGASHQPWAVFYRQEGTHHVVGADSFDYRYWWYGGGRFASPHPTLRVL
ncbi:MAG: hypothetical protein UY20_C0005G0009 [Candidatus Yanofskybacteria bacterium GW2011_GWA1_48_10]|uniref:Uncharacterized protein n=1 Tax=Candidatus Yanofskybacteria bacterium GW2011_GWA1_48_10 TaxID=1619022 RepID=A0A0G1X5V6_9BACT|nr:MAG: hypothetical protein UY20_C0005G0009 [Candidatus Yanofskybacteria bacterium GW2011_GWA1_48_10]